MIFKHLVGWGMLVTAKNGRENRANSPSKVRGEGASVAGLRQRGSSVVSIPCLLGIC